MPDEELVDISVLTDDEADVQVETQVEAEPIVETEPEAVVEAVDVEAIIAKAKAEAIAEIQNQQQQQVQVVEENDDAEIAAIADLRYSNPVEAERRSLALARKQVAREYGQTLQSAGQVSAIADAKIKFADLPAEVQPFLEPTVRKLGVQGPIPAHLMEPIKQLAYGAAAIAGVPIGKTVPKTIRAAGSDTGAQITRGAETLPPGATEFERAFGKAALDSAMKGRNN